MKKSNTIRLILIALISWIILYNVYIFGRQLFRSAKDISGFEIGYYEPYMSVFSFNSEKNKTYSVMHTLHKRLPIQFTSGHLNTLCIYSFPTIHSISISDHKNTLKTNKLDLGEIGSRNIIVKETYIKEDLSVNDKYMLSFEDGLTDLIDYNLGDTIKIKGKQEVILLRNGDFDMSFEHTDALDTDIFGLLLKEVNDTMYLCYMKL